MKLIGTRTSPFVRRVRIVAHLVGAPLELCDSTTEEGVAALKRTSPIWKVPVLETDDGLVILDSHAIADYLIERFGPGPFVHPPLVAPPAAERIRESNRVQIVDGALDAAINVLYLRREGILPAAAPYLQKQMDRVASAMQWLDGDLPARAGGADGGAIDAYAVAVVTTLDWMRFRDMYPVDRHPRLAAFAGAYDSVDAFVSTRPVG